MIRKPRRPPRAQVEAVLPAEADVTPTREPGLFAVTVYDVAAYLVLHHKDAPVHGVAWPDLWLDVGTVLVHYGWVLPNPEDPHTHELLSAAFVVGWTSRQAVDVVKQFLQVRPDLPAITLNNALEKLLAVMIADGCYVSLADSGRTLSEQGWRPGDPRIQ